MWMYVCVYQVCPYYLTRNARHFLPARLHFGPSPHLHRTSLSIIKQNITSTYNNRSLLGSVAVGCETSTSHWMETTLVFCPYLFVLLSRGAFPRSFRTTPFKTRKVVWTIKKFQGSSELTLRTKVTLPTVVNAASRKEVCVCTGTNESPRNRAYGGICHQIAALAKYAVRTYIAS